MREKSRFSVSRERPHQQRLAQPGHAFQQTMPADKQARQHAMHDVAMPDDHAAQLLVNSLVALGKLGRPLFDRFSKRHGIETYRLGIGHKKHEESQKNHARETTTGFE